jgi:hypothetical protein
MKAQTYQIEITLEHCPESADSRTDTITIELENQDIFIAVAHVVEEYYPAKLLELHCELVEDEEDKDDDK